MEYWEKEATNRYVETKESEWSAEGYAWACSAIFHLEKPFSVGQVESYPLERWLSELKWKSLACLLHFVVWEIWLLCTWATYGTGALEVQVLVVLTMIDLWRFVLLGHLLKCYRCDGYNEPATILGWFPFSCYIMISYWDASKQKKLET